MTTSKEEIPQLLLVEALASTPYLVKLALTDAKSEAAVPAADLAEIETALALLRVPGWREGEATGRPPFVRRNLLLLHAHLHREHLKAVTVSEETKVAQAQTAYKAGTLLDMFFVYTMQVRTPLPPARASLLFFRPSPPSRPLVQCETATRAGAGCGARARGGGSALTGLRARSVCFGGRRAGSRARSRAWRRAPCSCKGCGRTRTTSATR